MADNAPKPTGKGRPTPTRKEREAVHKRPLVLDRKQDSSRRRAERRLQFQREQEAMATGNERYMPPQHAGAPRRFARDYIDSRTTVAEFIVPFSLVALFAMMFLAKFPDVVTTTGLVVLLMLIAGAVESLLLVRRLRRRAIEKFGEEKLPRLYRLYGLTRMLQVRRLRMPKPQVKRGQFPQ
jgi:Flp pilus assembly protein TadB